MFDLNQAIAEWRRQIDAEGVKGPRVLDELESHLRDDIEQQLRSGLSPEQAFETAAARMGKPQALNREFAKAYTALAAFRKMMGFASILLVGFILWLSGFTFLQMQMTSGEQILAYTAVACTLMVACGWRYAVPFLPVISNKPKRIVIGSACIVSGFLCTSFFANVILPHFERAGQDGQLPAVGFWAVFPIAVCAGLGLGLMMSARDREHWGMKKLREC
jgi:hypothetical protein